MMVIMGLGHSMYTTRRWLGREFDETDVTNCAHLARTDDTEPTQKQEHLFDGFQILSSIRVVIQRYPMCHLGWLRTTSGTLDSLAIRRVTKMPPIVSVGSRNWKNGETWLPTCFYSFRLFLATYYLSSLQLMYC
jgi:hypothetical protein